MKIDPLMKIKKKEKKSVEKSKIFEPDFYNGDELDDEFDENKKNKKSRNISLDEFTEEDELEF